MGDFYRQEFSGWFMNIQNDHHSFETFGLFDINPTDLGSVPSGMSDEVFPGFSADEMSAAVWWSTSSLNQHKCGKT